MTTLKTQSKYSSIIATATHLPVRTMADFKKKYDQPTMGFFLHGKDIGYGDLLRCEYVKNRMYLQTDNVRIRSGFRRKGHGINLYIHLIETARKIGAKRIYSSTSLNKFSRKMWGVKLPKIYEVKTVYTCKPCSFCSVKSRRALGYYIVLA